MGFTFFGEEFPLEPKTFFYDWLYICALRDNPSISGELLGYDAFTDISFNPEKSLNCQARTAAIYVSLEKAGILHEAIESPKRFKEIVYGVQEEKEQYFEIECEQLTLTL